MTYDPEIDTYICEHCSIVEPLTYDKLKEAAYSRGLVMKYHVAIRGNRYYIDYPTVTQPLTGYKTRVAALREGLIRWIKNDTPKIS